MGKLFLICIGLIISFCAFSVTQTYNGSVIHLTNHEEWLVNGEKYKIEGTMIVPMVIDKINNKVEYLFAVKAYFNEPPNKTHTPIAKFIAKYALKNGYFVKARNALLKMNIATPINEKIGVALIYNTNIIIANHATGYRYQFSIKELEQ